MKKIIHYKTSNGKYPYDIWFSTLDQTIKARIEKRLERIEDGNYGDHKRFDNLVEIRFKQGAGYRIYAFEYNDMIFILLSGGDKSTQNKDIEKAKSYIDDIKERYK
ncbi:MAG: type II toxin-antitoxin system RelE/ParE family toxin [Candidatus Gastranaerophilales bacterium]|nr:type II toxin-antitoxin system RelE/ParE family toxin [Candidatus Gastranaerophilales bacterium]